MMVYNNHKEHEFTLISYHEILKSQIKVFVEETSLLHFS